MPMMGGKYVDGCVEWLWWTGCNPRWPTCPSTDQRGCFNVDVYSCLVHMHSKWRSVDAARKVFDKATAVNVACPTAVIVGYVNRGEELKSSEIFRRMQAQGIPGMPFLVDLAMHGRVEETLEHFEQMHHEGVTAEFMAIRRSEKGCRKGFGN